MKRHQEKEHEPSLEVMRPNRHVVYMENLATALDSLIRIPGTDFRVGIDPLLGLVPAVGDFMGAVLSASLIYLAARAGFPIRVIARMVGNIVMDEIVGLVPVVGDFFDFAWKANVRNVMLAREYVERGSPLVPRSAHHVTTLGVVGMLFIFVVLLSVLIGSIYVGLSFLLGWR